jgi:hypothetical protein
MEQGIGALIDDRHVTGSYANPGLEVVAKIQLNAVLKRCAPIIYVPDITQVFGMRHKLFIDVLELSGFQAIPCLVGEMTQDTIRRSAADPKGVGVPF